MQVSPQKEVSARGVEPESQHRAVGDAVCVRPRAPSLCAGRSGSAPRRQRVSPKNRWRSLSVEIQLGFLSVRRGRYFSAFREFLKMRFLNCLVSCLGYLLPDMIDLYPGKLHTSEISLGLVFIFPKVCVYKEDKKKEVFCKRSYKIWT